MKLFTDYTSLFSIVHNKNISFDKLKIDLEKIRNWSYQWKMCFDPDPSTQVQEVVSSYEVLIKSVYRLLITVITIHPPLITKFLRSGLKNILVLGKVNLSFCCTGSQENYFGLVSLQNNYNNLSFRVGISKNKNIDHRVTYETNHISLLRDSTMPSAYKFYFLFYFILFYFVVILKKKILLEEI